MKKLFVAICILAFSALPVYLVAQEKVIIEKRLNDKDAKAKSGSKETEEIIIRKEGGEKEINMKVEINGDEITINGKPLSEFKDKNITINKRKMIVTDGKKKMEWNMAPEGGMNFGGDFNEMITDNIVGDEAGNKAFLGVTTEKNNEGVKIMEVVKGSAAEKAGLKKDDIILKVGDEKITSPESLSDVIGFKKPADEVKVVYKRNGKEASLKVVLGERKQQNTRVFTFKTPEGNTGRHEFRGMPNMEGAMPEMFNMDGGFGGMENMFPRQKKVGIKIQDTEDGGGVKVINVEDSSAAAAAGLKKDDIITEINGKKIDNTDDAREELVPEKDKKSYKIKILRSGSEMNFDVKIPRKLKTANL